MDWYKIVALRVLCDKRGAARDVADALRFEEDMQITALERLIEIDLNIGRVQGSNATELREAKDSRGVR